MRSFEDCRINLATGSTTPVGHAIEGEVSSSVPLERTLAMYLRSCLAYDVRRNRLRVYSGQGLSHTQLLQADVDAIRSAVDLDAAETVTRRILSR